MKKRIIKLLLFLICIAALIVTGVWLVNWLNRPLPVSLEDPSVQPLKDILAQSRDLEYDLRCGGNTDLGLLDEVYLDTDDFKPNKDNKILIAKYLGKEAVDRAGYLTYKKAYFLWSRSGDPYPRSSTEVPPHSLTKIAPTKPPIHYCPSPFVPLEIRYRNIAIRDARAVVRYESSGTVDEAVLIRSKGKWFIVSIRVLLITA